jgi:hypothetical protein
MIADRGIKGQILSTSQKPLTKETPFPSDRKRGAIFVIHQQNLAIGEFR